MIPGCFVKTEEALEMGQTIGDPCYSVILWGCCNMITDAATYITFPILQIRLSWSLNVCNSLWVGESLYFSSLNKLRQCSRGAGDLVLQGRMQDCV